MKEKDCVFRRVTQCEQSTTGRSQSCCCSCGERKTCKRVCGYLTKYDCCELGKQVDTQRKEKEK